MCGPGPPVARRGPGGQRTRAVPHRLPLTEEAAACYHLLQEAGVTSSRSGHGAGVSGHPPSPQRRGTTTAIVPAVSVEFILTSLVVVLIPGTGVVYTVASSLAGGRRRGLFAAMGCTLGIVPHMLAAMLGLSGVMQAGAVAFEVVRWAGVAYLVYMGVTMIVAGGALRLDDEEPSTVSTGLVVRRGILLNLLNPKLTVFFFAYLPQFLETAPGLFDGRLMLLGGVFMLMTLVVFAAYAYLSAAIRDRLLGAPAALKWLQRSLGALLIGFAARLAVADR